MGMLRLRFIGDKVDPNAAAPRYGTMIERPRDHTFCDFSGWTASPRAGTPPFPPAGWTPVFATTAAVPIIEMIRLKDSTSIAQYLDQVWWLDIDVSKFLDEDYNVYFYGITAGAMQFSYAIPIVAGDDLSLSVRFRKEPILFAFNGNFTGLPGATGTANVKGTANLNIAYPAPAPLS